VIQDKKSSSPLHAATTREKEKIRKHQRGSNNENLTFFPCVYETFGPPGRATSALWKQLHLQATSNRVPECSTLTNINQEININIIKGQAMIANVTCYEDTGTSLLHHTSTPINSPSPQNAGPRRHPPQSRPNSLTRRGTRRLIPNNDNPARRGRLAPNVPLWDDVGSQATQATNVGHTSTQFAAAVTQLQTMEDDNGNSQYNSQLRSLAEETSTAV
jgi:hypothetical protein